MFVSDLITDFVESLEVEQGRAANTARNYDLYLSRLLEFAGPELKPTDITTELLRKYRLWLNRYEGPSHQSLSAITQAYHLIALRGFLKYLSRRHIPSLDPTLVDLPKAIKKQVTFLHYDEIEQMLGSTETTDQPEESTLRDRAIIELLFSSGLADA